MTVNTAWAIVVTAVHVTNDMASIAQYVKDPCQKLGPAGAGDSQSRGKPVARVGCPLWGGLQPKAPCLSECTGQGPGLGAVGTNLGLPAWCQ